MRGLFAKQLGAAILALVTLVPLVFAAGPHTQFPGTRSYLIATGFLCGLGASACPDIAMAHNGDRVNISGSGTLSIHPKSVSGAGTFVHYHSNGAVVASGTWTAVELLSFTSYGLGTGDFAGLEGGQAVIRVHLVAGAVGLDAILKVTCDIGPGIPAGAVEGVTLAVQRGLGIGLNFNTKVSGITVFIP